MTSLTNSFLVFVNGTVSANDIEAHLTISCRRVVLIGRRQSHDQGASCIVFSQCDHLGRIGSEFGRIVIHVRERYADLKRHVKRHTDSVAVEWQAETYHSRRLVTARRHVPIIVIYGSYCQRVCRSDFSVQWCRDGYDSRRLIDGKMRRSFQIVQQKVADLAVRSRIDVRSANLGDKRARWTVFAQSGRIC